jgi:hypothetical protein
MSTLVSPRNVEPMRGEPPGPKGVPYFGCVGEMRRNPMRFFTKVAQTYGGIARIPLMTGSHVYLVSEPALLHELLVANRDKYMKNVRYRQAQDLVGLGLLLSGDTFAIGGVGHDEEALVGEAIDDQVVDDAAVGGTHHRVVGAPVGQAARIGHQRPRQAGRSVRTADPHLAHVREVEEAGPLAHRMVLVNDAAVLDRHLPAGEVDQPATQPAVLLDERRLLHAWI